jgi:low temperature requirement protein LtrA
MRHPTEGRILGAGGTFRLEPPRLRTTGDASEERHATWFELYFDLVFVAAISQLGAALAEDPSGAVFARFAGLFLVVVWAWVQYTLYANRFDTDDLIFRLAKSAGMLAIAAVAIDVHRVMAGDGGTMAFAIGYVALRLPLIGLYARARQHVLGPGRTLCETYIAGYGFTTGLWFASIFVPSPGRIFLWGAAMAIDLLIPTRAWAVLKDVSVVVSHLAERYGTFFIIVLGESVVAVVAGVAGFEFTFESWVVACACFVIALCLWWVYFDLADTSVIGRGVMGLVFVDAHFPLLAGVAAFGEGTRLAIVGAAHSSLGSGARWALAGGLGVFALSLATLHLGAEWTSPRDRTFVSRIWFAVLALVLAGLGGGLPPVVFVLLLAVAVLGQLMIEAFSFKAGAASVWAPPDTAAELGVVAQKG